ncbi:MAG TPA: rhodanese-like domain-containing protein [Polyangia bacterium]|jgi:rhodanese-related sulfurtransferase|nr:rhodanese-like domain-containing protein [Polyangia bacterium]
MTKRVLPAEAAGLVSEGWTYLDVRSTPEFEQGHPKGAVNIPLLNVQGGRMVPNPDFQKVVESNFPKDTKLVIGCKSGGRSLQAAALLTAAGYASVVDMQGGFGGGRDNMGRVRDPGWADSGLPVATTCDPGKSYQDLAKKT